MKVKVTSDKVLREWPHVERYQNTTLRYTPDARFPKVMEEVIGKPEIIRLFITLDEVWDYRTGEYHWDYLIGENRYLDDPNHYHYDWPLTVPSPFGVHVQEYLVSHAASAHRVLLNIRRYEREVTDGIISLDQYAILFKKVVSYYKDLCPNIEYIECCNEVEILNFGNLTMEEYYPLYICAYQAITQLNEKYEYKIPLKIGGFGMSAGVSNWKYWDDFLTILSKDKNRKIDFYSMHEYHTNPTRILEFYVRHQEKINSLELPHLPLMMSEYGLRTGIGDAGRPTNLQNASGEIRGFILGSYCTDLKIFPWCTFHNPNQQLGRTMFIQSKESYIPTPSGHVMSMLHRLGTHELLVEGYVDNTCVATKDDEQICILLSNPGTKSDETEITIAKLETGVYDITEYMVDEKNNNCLNDITQDELRPTKVNRVEIKDFYQTHMLMMENSFCLLTVKRVRS